MHYRRFIITLSLLAISVTVTTSQCHAQYPSSADDLRALILSAQHDTTRAQALLYLAVVLYNTEPDSSLQLSEAALRIVGEKVKPGPAGLVLKSTEKKAFNRIKAIAQLNIAHYHRAIGDTIAAMKQYEVALDQFTRAKFEPGIRDALLAIGELHAGAGNTEHGNYFLKRANLHYANASNSPYGSTGSRLFMGYKTLPDLEAHTQENKEVDERSNNPSRMPVSHKLEPLEPTVRTVEDLDADVPMANAITTSPTQILYSQVTSGNEGPSATQIRLDSNNLAKYRDRLSRPVQKDRGEQAAREHFELGEALELIREPALAEASFRRSLVAYNTLGSDSGQCVALLRIGKLRGEQSDYQAAFSALDSARTKARSIGRHDLEGIALAGMGDMCRKIEECGGASKLYQLSIQLAHSMGDKRTEARGYLGMTEELVDRGSLPEAEPLAKMGLDIASQAEDPELKQQGALLLRGVYTKMGRLQEADSIGEIARQNALILASMDLETEAYIQELRNTFTQTTSALEKALGSERMKAQKNWKAAVSIGALALLLVVGGFLFYRSDRHVRQARADRRSTELEIKALRSQMNPHFLFNALNSIQEHIQENEPDVAADYLAMFSKLMRQVLEMSRLNEVTLQRELDVLGMYVGLERMRLKNRFEYFVEVSSEVDPEAVSIPPMLLQPFVENAVWHGLAKKDGPGLLRLSVARADGTLQINIEDDGVGRYAAVEKGDGHRSLGTSITQERLDLWSTQRGRTATFAYLPVSVGTSVELVLPWEAVDPLS